ncbi:hypothetical protein JTE90_000222 [Oedothorax gibbosus]|uniref:DDE Tnp4 domain-containing protein n=1 Tax=Oedothorax gibbosus TaxID=931172 RepID=A0AAV6VD78_9ARAC|nr:hypothetical protein JTE90_000222 [Oedothorax gibbosus]
MWTRRRTDNWWAKIVIPMDETEWRNNFRISKSTYRFLCEKLTTLDRMDTRMRHAIRRDKRIAIAVYTLSSSAEYRTIGNLFGVSKSSVCKIVAEFCTLFVHLCSKDFIQLPTTEQEILRAATEFESFWDFPQCVGAIDGTHIKIQPPKVHAHSYYNYKQFYSVVLLAVVDYAYKFMYVNVGSCGRNNDAYVFQNSSMPAYLRREEMGKCSRELGGLQVPVYVVGDSAFPLMQTLQKPYPEFNGMPDTLRNYNYRLSRGRRVVENAFGRLKARFRILRKLENRLDTAVNIIHATCILNNVCEIFGDSVDPVWMNDVQLDSANTVSIVGNRDVEANNIREATAAHLFENQL